MADHETDRPAGTLARRGIVVAAAALSIASLAAEYGFYLSPLGRQLARAAMIVAGVLFVFEGVLAIAAAPSWGRGLKAAPGRVIAPVLAVLALLLVKTFAAANSDMAARLVHFCRVDGYVQLYYIVVDVFLVFMIGYHGRRSTRRIADSRLRPTQALISAFSLVILTGALLLMLPKAHQGSLHFVDALFTSVSAVCVTGLTVVDTADQFSRTGQIILMFLIQIGGLGIMTFAAVFAVMIGGGLGIREGVMMREVLNVEFVQRISGLLVSIVVTTFIVEAAGAVLLCFLMPGADFTVVARLFFAVFHSVSAFCNAGFSVYSRGMEPFYEDVSINFVLVALIVIGGLGFSVQRDLWRVAFDALRRRRPRSKVRLQTQIVLIGSAALIVSGAVAIYLLERGNLPLLQAFFQSVTARSAGFHTTPQVDLDEGSQFLTMLLMFIGAAPGSTGGGIKITTVAVIVATVIAMTKGRRSTEILRRTLPEAAVRESIVVLSLSVFAVSVSVMLLLVVETGSFRELLFEAVSAFGTVGLSLGQTEKLGVAGKIIVMLTMFFGRIGPMTIALAVASRSRPGEYAYPTERVMVG